MIDHYEQLMRAEEALFLDSVREAPEDHTVRAVGEGVAYQVVQVEQPDGGVTVEYSEPE
jgi:hypothetical protein